MGAVSLLLLENPEAVMTRTAALVALTLASLFVAGCAAEEKKSEPRGSTSSKAIGGACSQDPFSAACEEQDRRDEQRREEREEEDRYRREQEEDWERNPGIEINEEDASCYEGDEWCVG
jgi:hypothetical protein